MSVPASERKESKAEFINIAIKLVIHTKSCCRKFPKSAMFITTKDIVDTVNEIGSCCIIANSRFPKNQWDVDFRKQYLQKARGSLDWLDFSIQQCYELYKGEKIKVSNYGWEEWGRLIYVLKGLLVNVMNSDQTRLQ